MGLRSYLYKLQKGRCHYCNCHMELRDHRSANYATQDHMYLKSKGGSDLIGNLVGACITCNNMRGNIPYHTFKTFIAVHGNKTPISTVLRHLTQEEYLKHRETYDAIRGVRFQSHLPIENREALPEVVYPKRRLFISDVRNTLAPVVANIPHWKRQEIWTSYERELRHAERDEQ